MKDENIVLFPKWKKKLKEESIQDLQAKRYSEALEKLNELIDYNVQDHEILIGKMMCLMELGRHQEAEDMCEELIQGRHDEHYYHYVHIYLTILFQSNKFDLLMERIEEELTSASLPMELKEQFLLLYDISEKMEMDIVEKKTSIYINDLLEAVELSDHKKQWRNIMKLKNMRIKPDSIVISLLEREDVHPVIKTAIFHWLQDHNYSKVVNVRKLGKELQITPVEVPEIKEMEIYKEINHLLSELEQKNPMSLNFIMECLYRYLYVHYPIVPPCEDVELIVDSLKQFNQSILNLDEKVTFELQDDYYINELMNSEKLYLSIIED